ncbi:hypothetical protein GSI_03587 [Ganoderma sinense ZZ0214-1]|uniref:Uncharacterized protein n=1 Tax=Ganoderma sinense ZZ0214-1 TaxID=1077348 RepID=A0A2G8SJE4_9APHY|nr:hypothetical protein GSI_03587 [Ganoderma sinense ZZ0214-1]
MVSTLDRRRGWWWWCPSSECECRWRECERWRGCVTTTVEPRGAATAPAQTQAGGVARGRAQAAAGVRVGAHDGRAPPTPA